MYERLIKYDDMRGEMRWWFDMYRHSTPTTAFSWGVEFTGYFDLIQRVCDDLGE